MIWGCAAVDFQAEVLVEDLILEHHFAGRTVQEPGALEQRAARLRQAGFEQVDIERAQFLQRAGHIFAEFAEALKVALAGIGQGEAENGPGVQRARYHTVKYFLPSRSCCAPFQTAMANAVPAGRSCNCMTTVHLPAAYCPCAGNDC